MAHRAIELVLEGGELDDAWSQGYTEEQVRSGSDPMDYPAARPTLLRLKKQLPHLLELLSAMPVLSRGRPPAGTAHRGHGRAPSSLGRRLS
jgi:hypothetical protein